MKKSIIILILIISIFAVGCSRDENDFIRSNKNKMKDTIDLVLSYENGYDDTMKKHISETNFYGSNFLEFYNMYIGGIELTNYKSKVLSIREEDGKYLASTVINIRAISLESHTHGDGTVHEGGHEVTSGDVAVEIALVEKDSEFYIEGFVGYESLEKAKEQNEGFR